MLLGVVTSEGSLLISPALRTLFGRLPRGAGEPGPPVTAEPGLLSPTRLLMRVSISRRLSALPGVGDINCGRETSTRGTKAVEYQGTNVARSSYAPTTCSRCVC